MEKLSSRFWEKVSKRGPSECWIWESAVCNGYGLFWVGFEFGLRRNEFAHRMAVMLDGRDIPPGMVVMHSCDNKLCVNPDHLEVGTTQDNRDDCVRKNRHARGEKNGGGGKLTWKDADYIRTSDLSGPFLGQIFGVHRRTINAIKRGEIWSP